MRSKKKVLSILLAFTLVLAVFTVPVPSQAANNNATTKKYLNLILDSLHRVEIVAGKGYKYAGSSVAFSNPVSVVKAGYYDDDDYYWDDDDDYWDDEDDDYWDDDDDYWDDEDDDYWDDDDDYWDDDDDDDEEDYSKYIEDYAKYIGVSSNDVYYALDDNGMEASDILVICADRYTSMCFATLAYDQKTGIFSKISNYANKVDKNYAKARKTTGLKNYYKAVYNYVKIFGNVDSATYKNNPQKFINKMSSAYSNAKKLKNKA